jgi:hypothetical protein
MSSVVVQAEQAKRPRCEEAAAESTEAVNKKSRVADDSDVAGLCADELVMGLESKDTALRLACAMEILERCERIEAYGAEVNRVFPDLVVLKGGYHWYPVGTIAGSHCNEVCAILAKETGLEEDFSLLASMSIEAAFDVPSDRDDIYTARRIIKLADHKADAPVIRFERKDSAQRQRGDTQTQDWCGVRRPVHRVIRLEAGVHGASAIHDARNGVCKLSFHDANGALWLTVVVSYGGLFDVEEARRERAAQQLVLYAKGLVEMDEANAEQKLCVSLEACWDGIAVRRNAETWMLTYEGEVSGDDLLRYLRAKSFKGEDLFAPRKCEGDIVVIEDEEEEAAEAPKKEELGVIDLTGEDGQTSKETKPKPESYTGEDGVYVELVD